MPRASAAVGQRRGDAEQAQLVQPFNGRVMQPVNALLLMEAGYLRMPKFNEEIAIAHGSGGYANLLAQWAKTDILVMDDLAMAPLSDPARRDLLEVPDDRHARRSTIVTSQIPVNSWHAAIGDPTLADAILDRLVQQRASTHAIRRIDAQAPKWFDHQRR